MNYPIIPALFAILLVSSVSQVAARGTPEQVSAEAPEAVNARPVREVNVQSPPLSEAPPPLRKVNEMQEKQRQNVRQLRSTFEESKEMMERRKEELMMRKDNINETRGRIVSSREAFIEKKTKELVRKARERVDAEKAEVNERVVERMEQRCGQATQRMGQAIERFDDAHKGQLKKYENLLKRLNKTASNFSEQGYDTSGLENAILGLDELVQKMATDYGVFVEKMQAAREFKCPVDDSSGTPVPSADGSIRELFLDTREALLVVREDIVAIREYYGESIRPELVALKEQRLDSKPAAE
ncbi:MAG: hypothetical protein N2691_05175 [Patescibacteria group bacterium]|nr:hypothetical protein [Patescibacteria group bacterium]